MLDAADRFHAQYTLDEADFNGWSAVMFPAAFKTDFKANIDAARAYVRDNVVVDEQVEEVSSAQEMVDLVTMTPKTMILMLTRGRD